ncbi:MAG: hypothetical protein ABR905_21650 [Terracidiphilus sp.]
MADLDTGCEDRSQKRAGEKPAPVIVHLVPEPGSARAVVPFESTKSEAGAIREDDPSPDGLQGVLSVAYVGVVNTNQCTPGRY